jgi:hypothetical protein
MIKQICLLAFLALAVSAQMGSGPPAIRNFYDTIFNDVKGSGQDINLIRQTFHEDWSTRPNPLNWDCKGPKCGPGPDGFKQIMGLWGTLFSDVYVERQYTLMCSNSKFCGDKVAMLSKFGVTVDKLPPGMTEFPMFPGIDPNRIIGKKCESMAIDIQIIKNEKIKRTWHFEDWAACLAQLLGEPQQLFMNPREDPGELLTEIPESIKNFYDIILQDPLGQGQNETLVRSVFNPDWNVRVNNVNPTKPGPGTGPNGNQKIFGLLGTFIPDLKFERQHIFLCGDHLAALSKVTGTITKTMPPGFDQIPLMPGIDPEKLLGKPFTTLALDIHMIKNKKLKHAWHIEDWATAADMILNRNGVEPDLGLDDGYISEENY